MFGKARFGLFLFVVARGSSTGDSPDPDAGRVDSSIGKDAVADAPTGNDATTTDGQTADASPDAALPSVRFVAMGDTGKGNKEQGDVAAGIAAKCQKDGCDFVQLLGDNIYDSGVGSTSDPEWTAKFVTPYQGIALDFWAVLGNHDYGANGAGTDFPRGQFEIDYSKVNTKWHMPAAYWQRTVGDVGFFAADTNMIFFYQDAKQRTDMTAWLAASKSTWKIALGHHPYLSNGPHGNAGNYDGIPLVGANVKSFMDDVVCGKADVYISGHDHNRQWLTATCKGTELIVSGAGASTTALKTTNTTYFQKDTVGFLYVRISGKTFTAEFCDAQGNVEYTRTLTKP